MRKKKKYFWQIIILCLIEMVAGVVIAKQFLVKAIEQKRILHPIEYSVLLKNTEEAESEILMDDTERKSGENDLNAKIQEERQKDIETIKVDTKEAESQENNIEELDYSSVNCFISHSLDSVKGAKIPIISATESSVIKQEGYSNTAYEAYDGDLSTSWQEGVDGPGLGSWLYYELDGTHYISDIVLYLGIWREAEGKDYYHDNYRPKEIQIAIGDWKWNVSFDDTKQPQVVHFSKPVPAESLMFTITDVYQSNRYEDMGIAEITAYEQEESI